jgi:hypothetical protein
MADDRFTRVTISVDDPIELFRMHEFDPFTDDVDSVSSLAQLAQLPHLIKTISTTELYILLPKERVTPQTQAQVRHALGRYCDHMVAEARRKLVALRWVGLRTMALGLAIFGISLAASTAVGRLLWIPEGLRVLASESLVVAGWVVIWQPVDSFVQGWWPHWEEERTFRALGGVRLSVHGVDRTGGTPAAS